MSQPKSHSLMEAIVNILIGYSINLGVQLLVFPLFHIHIPLSSNIGIGLIFTVISLVRSYLLRRIFDRFTAYRKK
jgi:hypothetical protein